MEFDEYGNLFPHKIIETDLASFERIFVISFVKSSNRITLFNQFQQYIEELKQIIDDSCYLWIDGSFITQKLNPADIDVLIFVKNSVLTQKEKQLNLLKSKFKPEIDSYFIEVLPENHKKYFLFEMNRKEWFFTFSTGRNFRNKGILQINI